MGWKCKWLYKLGKKATGGNWGHRLYGDRSPLPENSMGSLKEGLGFQHFEKFRYWEFDVVESKDGFLYVFHDATKRKTIKRLCPTASKELRKKSLYQLTSTEIETLTLLDTQEKIPSLAELLSEFGRQEIVAPIRIEIKKLLTRQAKYDLVIMAKTFRDAHGYDVEFMMFRSKFKKVFKDDKDWFMNLLEQNGFELIWI